MGFLIGLIVALFLAAAACVIAGIYLLAGLAWALIGSGVLLFAAAMLLRAGMTAHG